jgi:hypothetical protein
LTRHKFVVGVSKHDELYKKERGETKANDEGGGGTPFAKNNAKNRRKSLAYGADAGRSLLIDLSAREASTQNIDHENRRADLDLEELGLTVLGRGKGKGKGSKSRAGRDAAAKGRREPASQNDPDNEVQVIESVEELEEVEELSSDEDSTAQMEDLSVEERDAAEVGFEDDVTDEEEGVLRVAEEEDEEGEVDAEEEVSVAKCCRRKGNAARTAQFL